MKIDATLRHGYVALTEKGNTRVLLSAAEAKDLAINLVLRAAEVENAEMPANPKQDHLPLAGGACFKHAHWCDEVTQGKQCNCVPKR